MARTLRFLLQALTMCLASLFVTFPVLAVPGLPSSFYGEVTVNGTYVPDGTVIQALVDGQVYAIGYTQTYQGASVYTLDIPGDDSDTTTLDGGREGDVVQFEIGGVLANQTGTWHSGTNINLALSASTDKVLNEPQATPSPVPTQTPIYIQPSVTRNISAQPLSVTATAFTRPSPNATESVQTFPPANTSVPASEKSAVLAESLPSFTPIMPSSSIPVEAGSLRDSTLTVIAILFAIVLGFAVWVVWKRMHIVGKPNSSKTHKAQGGS